jgi:ABC-2 type transport system permease protein
LYDQLGIQPLAQGFLSPTTYYLHMVLLAGDKIQVIYPSSEVSEGEIRDQIESSLQRAAPGFFKGVGVWVPPDIPQTDMFGQPQQSFQSYQTVVQALRENYDVRTIDLSTGDVPTGIDVLLVIAPENLTDIERYAVDQYLMRGGTLFVAAGNFKISVDQFSGALMVLPIQNGLQEMLDFYGVKVDQTMVLDPQNTQFPLRDTQNVGGVTVQTQKLDDYPYFIDVRADGMDRDNPILSRLPSFLAAWASPVVVDADKNADRHVTTLLQSTKGSWLSASANVNPGGSGFKPEGETQRHPLAVVVEGRFESFFKGKPSPFEAAAAAVDPANPNAQPPAAPAAGPIESSPDTARLIVVGSSEFLNDVVFNVADSFGSDSAVNNTQFVQNAVDWATEDTDLLAIRSRGSAARALDPLSDNEQTRWEVLNYVVALVSLGVLGVVWQMRKRAEKPMPLGEPAEQTPVEG